MAGVGATGAGAAGSGGPSNPVVQSGYSYHGDEGFGTGNKLRHANSSTTSLQSEPERFSTPNMDTYSVRSGRSVQFSHSGNNANPFLRKNINYSRIPIFFKRLLKPPTLDFETAIWEIFYLVVSPRRVYRSLYYHTKNSWARDDPSFVILLTGFLVISAIAWGLAYSPGFFPILKLIIYMVVVDFYLFGIVIATIGWFLADRFLHVKRRTSADGIIGASIGSEGVGTEIEWAYCFDVHCNAFLMVWVILYLVQFILLPLVSLNNSFSALIGNTLYYFSMVYYIVITFHGYNTLPFLEHTQLILIPIPVFFVLYIISVVLGVNISKIMVDYYFK